MWPMSCCLVEFSVQTSTNTNRCLSLLVHCTTVCTIRLKQFYVSNFTIRLFNDVLNSKLFTCKIYTLKSPLWHQCEIYKKFLSEKLQHSQLKVRPLQMMWMMQICSRVEGDWKVVTSASLSKTCWICCWVDYGSEMVVLYYYCNISFIYEWFNNCLFLLIHCMWCWIMSGKEGNRNTRRKHKRKSQLSRAADAELADICLEQQVLREIMLPQQPAEDKVVQDASQSSSLRLNPADSSPDSPVSCCFSYSLMISVDGR